MRKLLALVFLFSLLSHSAWASLAIDGSVLSTTPSLTTTQSDDVIVCFIKYGTGPISSVSGGSLTWTRRATTYVSGNSVWAEEWYAIAASPLNAVSITQSGASNGVAFSCFGISGANTTTPYDTNASLPAKYYNVSGTTPLTTTISTDNANDMLLDFGVGASSGSWTQPTGFTVIKGCSSSTTCLSEKVVAATQSSLSVSLTDSVNIYSGITEAIQAASGAATPENTFMGTF